MGRLTDKKFKNKPLHDLCGVNHDCTIDCEDCFVIKLYRKLAHYEDLEEQGRLIEVVRCKECWRYDTGAGYDGWGLCELYDQDRKDNDYCSFGELKELEGDKE